jgi:type I site-specific restriction endonuclease
MPNIKKQDATLNTRSVKSWSFFEQMKGRGVRVIIGEDLNAGERGNKLRKEVGL